MVAAYSVGGSTYVYDSLSPSYGSTWTNLTAATPIPGSNPRLSFGGSSALLITKTQCTVYATTIYPYGSPSYTTYSTLAYPQQAAPFWVADSAQGEEGFVVATDSSFVISQAGAGWSCSSGGPSTGQLIEYTSVDGGHTYSSKTIGVYRGYNSSSAFNSVGSTGATYPGATPGQVAVAGSNTSVFGPVHDSLG